MKLLLLLLVVLGVGYYYYFYREQTPAPKEPGAEVTKASTAPAPASSNKQGFDSLTTLLQQDMSNIPAPLDGPGRSPANAMAIKRRVGPYVNTRPEYRVLTEACDLIVQADAQRTTFQQACHAEQTRVSFGDTLNSTGSMDHSVPASHGKGFAAQAATPPIVAAEVHKRIEGNWVSYRAHASEQVNTLLASLADKRL